MIEAVTPEISLADVRGRAQLVIALAKLYVLLVRMAAAMPPRAGRYPIFHTIKRGDGVTVEIMSNRVIKRIPGFDDFCEQHQTTAEALHAAYKAADEEAIQARAEQRCPALACALQPLAVKWGTYLAVTGPLGYCCTPSTEQVG